MHCNLFFNFYFYTELNRKVSFFLNCFHKQETIEIKLNTLKEKEKKRLLQKILFENNLYTTS